LDRISAIVYGDGRRPYLLWANRKRNPFVFYLAAHTDLYRNRSLATALNSQFPVPFAVVNSFIFEVFVIPTESMSPTILGGDRIVAKKMTPTNHFPSRGDLIVYQNPTLVGGDRFVGRAVAVAGDKIRIDGESVLVNDSELVRERVPNESLKLFGERVKGQVEFEVNSGRRYLVSFQEPRSGNDEEDVFETTVPERHVFVLGDNRSKSRDSRQFGSIHSGDIVGYVEYIHWPAQSWSRFGVADDRLP